MVKHRMLTYYSAGSSVVFFIDAMGNEGWSFQAIIFSAKVKYWCTYSSTCDVYTSTSPEAAISLPVYYYYNERESNIVSKLYRAFVLIVLKILEIWYYTIIYINNITTQRTTTKIIERWCITIELNWVTLLSIRRDRKVLIKSIK